jgi:hypothetical protein
MLPKLLKRTSQRIYPTKLSHNKVVDKKRNTKGDYKKPSQRIGFETKQAIGI